MDDQAKLNVLVVDDDADIVRQLRPLLEDPGDDGNGVAFQLTHAGTLTATRERLVRDEIDIILLDVQLPDADYAESLRFLTKLAPHLPIVVWTDSGDRAKALKMLRMGAQDYLEKSRMDSYWLPRILERAIDRKRVERQKQVIEERLWESHKMESLGALAGGVAHDFNNMLCGILGNASLALETIPENSTAGECLRDIERVSERASSLCRQMLAYSGGRQTMAEHFDLNELISADPELLRVSISPEANLVTRACADALPIMGDRSQIGQVIVNLVLNASDALSGLPGTIEIETRLVTVGENYFQDAVLQPKLPVGRYCCLAISDTGAGMDKRTLERIFDPFFTTKFIGRGMGLPAALGIIRSHKGAIKVFSEVGAGTAIRIFLPISGVAAATPSLEKPNASEWTDSGLVLLVDDEEPVRRAAARFLRRMGYSIIEALNGMEGYERFMSNRSELRAVVMDLTMPGMDGGTLCAEILKVESKMPILLMSGYSRNEVMHRVDSPQDLPFMPKPFTYDVFRTQMENLLAPTSGQ
ncbi:MAG: hybrid sensor histidine kinase/response regulator [Limisphaerales bacterium]